MTEPHSSGGVSTLAAPPAPPPVPRRLDQNGGVPPPPPLPPPPPPVSHAPPTQQPQQRETRRAYNGFEVAEGGTEQEHNYLFCDRGDMIKILTQPFAGHTANRFSTYVYGQRGDENGWVPEAVFGDENDDDEKNWRIEAGLWGVDRHWPQKVDQAVAYASSGGGVSAAAVACPQTAGAACPKAAFIVVMRPQSSQSLSEAACPQAAAAACRNDGNAPARVWQ